MEATNDRDSRLIFQTPLVTLSSADYNLLPFEITQAFDENTATPFHFSFSEISTGAAEIEMG